MGRLNGIASAEDIAPDGIANPSGALMRLEARSHHRHASGSVRLSSPSVATRSGLRRSTDRNIPVRGNIVTEFEVFPMPPALGSDVLDQLARAEVATIGHWRRWGFPNRGITRVAPGPTIVGTAVTVACPSEDNTILHHAISLLRPGDILVVDRLGDMDVACYGGTVNLAAKLTGAAGVVIDGPCTDIREIRESGFAVWCRGVSGRTSRVRGGAGRLNVPVSIGGAVVMPGDALLCDDDGILVIPPQDIAEEAAQGIGHQQRVEGVVAQLEAGKTLAEMNGASAKVLGEGATR